MTPRENAIRDRLARGAVDPAGGRAVVDELTDELVELRVDAPPAAEDREVLGILTAIIRADPVTPSAGLAADVLAAAGHRRGAERSPDIDSVLLTALDRALDAAAASPDWAPIASALADLNATRPILLDLSTARRALTAARAEPDPSLIALDSVLTLVRGALDTDWPGPIYDWFPDLRPTEPLAEAVRFANEIP